MKISISTSNRKLGPKVATVSLPPVKACGNCDACRTDCYAKKRYRQYPSVKAAWDRNLRLWTKNRYLYLSQIHDYLEDKKPARFRWHTSGDILSQGYLNGMIDIATAFPKTNFLVYTKMYWLNYPDLIPDNLCIVFSVWPGLKLGKQAVRFPLAFMLDKNNPDSRIPATAIPCSGSCDTCERCWHLKPGDAVVFHKH